MDTLGQLSASGASIVAVLAALAALWVKVLRPRWRRFWGKLDAATASIVGREEITDPATGRVLAPAVPGIGVRMSNVEDAVTLLVANQSRLDEHDRRIGKLEEAAVERIVTRADSLAGWQAVSAAFDADPAETPAIDEQPDLD